MTGSEPDSVTEAFPRPQVAAARKSHAPLIFGLILAVSATGLFFALEARRTNLSSPAISVPSDSVGGRSLFTPPALTIPQTSAADFAFGNERALAQPDGLSDSEIALLRRADLAVPPMSGNYVMARDNAPYPYPPPPPPQVMQATPTVLLRPQSPPAYQPQAEPDPDRAVATRFANPSSTVPKGTVIHAVLETAFDSTRPGFARAIISRDVRSFDGGRILVPKGSKLLGEYQADLNHGQDRALIQWHRLMLPDGVLIDVDSPSVDALGRAGVKGKVNSHFFSRFGGAILQSVLDVGVQVATRKAAGDTFIVGLPIGNQEKIAPQTDVKPTLTIRQGSSVAVLVARDLDFTNVLP